ncbi:MAG: DUF1588 domain-containing protein, partial [Bdellovibrio sp.]|nr:DUF1588 domain-containing protein [Bdellovibrio sp.]
PDFCNGLRMKQYILFTLTLILSLSSLAEERVLSDVSYLNKLSMSLRGYAPSMEEIANLQNSRTNDVTLKDFFNSTIADYQQSSQYRERMVIRVDELLFFNAPTFNQALTPELRISTDWNDIKQYSAAENLVRAMTQNNLSWDQLLLAKSYKVPTYSNAKTELSFYDGITGQTTDVSYTLDDIYAPISEKPTYVNVSTSQDDPRIAGIITTERFFSRYTTTALNKNRRRAAAIFRIFMCDPMSAAIPEVHDTSRLKDLIFPTNGQSTESQIRESLDSKHGTQADCMKCHYKLDPLGTTLRASSVALHERSSSGRLVFRRANGEIINKAARGIGDIAKLITEQPEYANCQVDHFWNWFIGKDVTRTPEINQELVKKFNDLGRKTNDFVAYLVSRPEFRIRKTNSPTAMVTSSARAFLQRCDACHSSQEPSLPAFAKWPIGDGSQNDSRYWMKQISQQLDLDHLGDNRTMPPEDGFRPSKAELKNLKLWIEMGAPNERGEKLVTP